MAAASPDPPVSTPHRYLAVSPWAIASAVFGLGSAAMIFATTVVGWLLLAVLPLAAIYFGRKALDQIRRMPEEFTGRWLAQAGIGLATALGIVGGVLIFFGSEVPHGYQVLDWAALEPDPPAARDGLGAVC